MTLNILDVSERESVSKIVLALARGKLDGDVLQEFNKNMNSIFAMMEEPLIVALSEVIERVAQGADFSTELKKIKQLSLSEFIGK